MRSSSSLQSSSGRSTPSTRSSYAEPKRPGSSRGFRPQSPKTVRSRPGSGMGSRPATPSFRPEPYTGTISVSIRPNPLHAGQLSWRIDEGANEIANVADGSSYAFDNVFPAAGPVTNAHVYQRSCAHLVENFLSEAYNCTLFAYGMTGSGKTYSMRGEDHDPGFVRLAIEDIYAHIAEQGSKTHALSVSYVEIYNEKIIDLLSAAPHAELKIRDDAEYGTRIVGITMPCVQDKAHLLQLISEGDTRRKTGATDFNSRSSRSHAIMQLRLHTKGPENAAESRCTLSLCDLAGSERATSSAERRKEGAFINKSLLALSTVINKLSLLSTGAGSLDHIPYRDLKLTRLLQPALSGLLLILILCTVHLGSRMGQDLHIASETANTLRFAARAKDIVLLVKANVQASDQSAAELRQTIERQRREIEALRAAGSMSIVQDSDNMQGVVMSASPDRVRELEAEVRVQKERIAHLSRLNDLQRTETVLLRNDALNDILGLDVENGLPKRMMASLEEFYSRVNYEMQEYRAYIASLEKQLQAKVPQGSQPARLERLVKDQEEEIWQLRETIKDKDHVIHSLTKTSKLRRLVDNAQHKDKDEFRFKSPTKT